ncbi:hypothetical protein YDYSG_46260 [Paenibacillus tyrfis]|uniref:hypothetical protein n=1 Tax=Paenibacillus TaxID=44249 RepID=UPI000ADCFB32|nr:MULTISPECIES: hypothetical protein [Paenibacillus]GLI08594.1 hypothetical protein YDYSG_46260 [Paenibacillus tyrfis]GMX66971.1 hypothetical protein Elgi_62440 [Paenibacillus elgii]
MRFVTKTRLDRLQTLLRSIADEQQQKEALHLLESLKRDIDENYAEIRRPIRIYEKNQ